jgi:hypothetical protein
MDQSCKTCHIDLYKWWIDINGRVKLIVIIMHYWRFVSLFYTNYDLKDSILFYVYKFIQVQQVFEKIIKIEKQFSFLHVVISCNFFYSVLPIRLIPYFIYKEDIFVQFGLQDQITQIA